MLAACHFAIIGQRGDLPHQIEAVSVWLSDAHRHTQPLAVKRFAAVLRRHVGKDDPRPADVYLAKTERGEQPAARFGHQPQQPGVVEVASFVDVLDIDVELGGKGQRFWQYDFHTGHDRYAFVRVRSPFRAGLGDRGFADGQERVRGL